MALFCLVYVSRALTLFTDQALVKLVQGASSSNAAKSITGMLLFNDGYFFQILEGEEAVVRQVMEKIARDPRHAEIHVVFEQFIDKRRCPNWNMVLLRHHAGIHDQPGRKLPAMEHLGRDMQSRTEKEKEVIISDLFCMFMNPMELPGFTP